MRPKEWPPVPGAVCRVNGHVGRYVGNGVGAYLADSPDGKYTSDPTQRPLRYYRATRPDHGDMHVPPEILPTNEQLEQVRREISGKPAS